MKRSGRPGLVATTIMTVAALVGMPPGSHASEPTSSAPQAAEKAETRTYRLDSILRVRRQERFGLRPQSSLALNLESDDEFLKNLPDDTHEGFSGNSESNRGEELQYLGGNFREWLDDNDWSEFFDGDSPSFQIESGDFGVYQLRASPKFHGLIGGIVEELRVDCGTSIRVDCVLIPPQVLNRILPAWREQSWDLPPAVFERALADEKSELLSVEGRSGQRCASGDGSSRVLLVDHSINQTGVVPVSNPVVTEGTGGIRMEACTFNLPETSDMLLNLVVGRYEVRSRSTKLGLIWSDLQLPIVDETLVSVGVPVRSEQVFVAGHSEGLNGTVALVRVGRESPEAAPQALVVEGKPVRKYDLSWIFGGPSRNWPSDSDAFNVLTASAEDSLFAVESVGEFFESVSDAWNLESDGLCYREVGNATVFVRADESFHQRLGEALRRRVDRELRTIRIELEEIHFPKSLLPKLRSLAGPGSVLASDWNVVFADSLDEIRRVRYGATGKLGAPQLLRGARLTSLIVDAEVVSGGTGFQIVERVDPVLKTVGEGFEIGLKVDETGKDGRYLLQIRAQHSELTGTSKVTCRFPVMIDSLSDREAEQLQGRGRSPETRTSVTEIRLELPRHSHRVWRIDREVPRGRHVLLETRAGVGRTARVLIGRIEELGVDD